MNSLDITKLLVGSAFVYAVVAACSSSSGTHLMGDGGLDSMGNVPEAMADVNQDGSRLKAQYYKGADGSKVFAGMYDSMLKYPCAFATASDGSSRCLPTGGGVVAATSFYSDSACTTPILSTLMGCTQAPPYASTLETGCDGTTTFHLFPKGTPFTPGADVYLKEGGKCTAIPTKNSTAYWYSLGAELPPSSFVQASLATE